jgi:hypothetical protein
MLKFQNKFLKLYQKFDIFVKILVSLFLFWVYITIYQYSNEISTFLFLFFIFPLAIASFIYYLLKIDFIYSFVIGFLIQWIIFLNINPYPLKNNNKLAIMSYIPENMKPDQEYLMSSIDTEQIKNLKYPIIIKPIICTTGGTGIHIFNSNDEFSYFVTSNEHKIDTSQYMIQSYTEDHDIEIGVLYERKPWEKTGKVIEIVEKTQKDKIRPLESESIVNHPELITAKVEEIIETLSRKIPEFYIGRYDIRLKHLEDLEKGDFKILEVNGCMGMMLNSNEYLFDNNAFITDSRWFLSRLQTGVYNIATLKGYNPLQLLQVLGTSLKNCITCDNWECLFALYS